MMGRTHAATGVAAGLIVAAVTGQVEHTPIIAYGLAGATALLPDLDQHRSLASRSIINKPLHMVLRHFRHRRFTHSILGTVLFALASGALWSVLATLMGLSVMVWVMALAGWTSHLVADAFNKQGIHLLYPFKPLGIEWVSIPLPRALRISTIYDPKGPPITLGRLQAYIPTELFFFKIPVYLIMGVIVFHQADALLLALRSNVWAGVDLAPGVLRDVLTAILDGANSGGPSIVAGP